MAIIRIEPSGADVSRDVDRALHILRRARLNARRRSMSSFGQGWGFLEADESDALRAVELLTQASVKASIRPR